MAVGRCVCDHPTLSKFGLTPDDTQALLQAIGIGSAAHSLTHLMTQSDSSDHTI